MCYREPQTNDQYIPLTRWLILKVEGILIYGTYFFTLTFLPKKTPNQTMFGEFKNLHACILFLTISVSVYVKAL